MAARAMWKGVVRFGGVEVPVKLYSAARDRTVHFRLLHAKDKVPVRQQMVNPVTGEVVDPADIRRGYEAGEGVYVVLEPEELDELEPEPSRDIEVTRFVDPGLITHQWYDRPYYLGPDGDAEAYFALAEALSRQEKEGVCRWVMRKKDYVGALGSAGDHLVLVTLRRAGEVVPASALPAPSGGAIGKREVAMAEQLVAMLEDEFDPAAYRDEYGERVRELIAAKAKGRKVRLKKPKPKETREPLERALARSIERARKGRTRAA